MHPNQQAAPALISVTDLAGMLGAPGIVVVDCRHDLARPDWGERSWRDAHVPGAAFAHLDRDLSGPVTARSGRHPLPDQARLAAFLGQIGIDRDTHVIAYDQGKAAYAARLWWLLRWLGHARVSVLDGGLAAWQAAGLPLDAVSPVLAPARFVITSALEADIGTAALQDELKADSALLFDARGADRFAGENETLDPVAGHVPGARNHPFTLNFDADGRLLPAQELARRWRADLDGRAPASVVSMCGSGVTACANLLAMHVAGLSGARLYSGSWSEWIRDPARPVATG